MAVHEEKNGFAIGDLARSWAFDCSIRFLHVEVVERVDGPLWLHSLGEIADEPVVEHYGSPSPLQLLPHLRGGIHVLGEGGEFGNGVANHGYLHVSLTGGT